MRNAKAVVLAAGKGTRMKSVLSKLIHRVYYQSLVESPAKACIESGIGETIVVLGHQVEIRSTNKKVVGLTGEYLGL